MSGVKLSLVAQQGASHSPNPSAHLVGKSQVKWRCNVDAGP